MIARQNRSHTTPSTRREIHARRAAMDARNRNALLVLVLPVMVIAKLMVVFFLPDKYFYDNNRILGMTNVTLGLADSSSMPEWEGSYRVASDLFAKLNIGRLDTLLSWSLCLGVLFTLLLMFMILRADAPDLFQSIFILAAVGLLNIYIFTIGKDIIQFAFFFAVYVVLLLPLDNQLIKILASAGILYFESTFFREYYILIAALILAVYVVLTWFRRRGHLGVGSMLSIVVILFLMIYAAMLSARVIMPDEYDQMLGLRAGYVTAYGDGADSATLIQNVISGDGLPIFMINYVINAFRMMIPIELFFRGVYYWPFFVFQLMVTLYMVHLISQMNHIKEPMLFLALCIYIGYILASFIFEPDFGSWVRHESATFPVLHLLVLNPYQRISITREERLLAKGLA